ncbi:MAG TPA: hypothetical protein DCQ29_08035, partial [Chitinophagaceae bacterium]|nr:hypothetical protein [Chitinophagaceae bacterium]
MNKLLHCYLRKYILLFIGIVFVKLISAQSYFPGGLLRSKLNLWLDATDSSTLTISNGVVTRWRDKANSLQANAPAMANAPVVNNNLIAGKRLLQFQGNKVLLVNDNARLDPNSGFNVMQVVHLHNDISNSYTSATDFRVGTFSRGENPFTNVPIGTASIAVRYIQGVNDNRYRVGLMRNSSTVMIGFNNQRFDDLAGSTHLLENYTTGFTNGDTIVTTQLNAAAAINGNYKFVNSTQQLGIGNRPTLYASVHWSIGETIFTGSSLGKCGKKILNAYLFYKWQLQRNIPDDIATIFSPLDTIFTNNLIGIGMEGTTDSVNGSATNNGMGFQNVTTNGFLREAGDYLLAADNNANGTVPLGSSFTRWNRVWYIDKTDIAGLGGNLQVYFDFAAYGIANQLDTLNNRYYLLYNSRSATFSSDTNYVIPVVNTFRLGNTSQFHFTVNGLHLSDGYYTIVYANRNIGIAQIPRLGSFPSIDLPSLRAPRLAAGFAGNTYNYLQFNIDSINYSIQRFKIYVSINGGATTLLDSVLGNTFFYAHYQLINGFSYSYRIKAVYASGIESEFSNAITLIPTAYIPTWRTLPQYAGARSVMMEASQPLPTAPYKFQFENITTNSTSTWLTSSQFREHNLLQGQTYNYRFRVMDTIHGNITTSGWSTAASVSIVDSAKGGFTYKFAFIDNNSIAPPNGIGPTTYNPLQIDTTGLRFIKHVPPPGVHPRIYCNPEDSMDIKWRLTNTASGRALAKYIHANTVLLQLGAGVFNGNANYNRDTLGVAIISNQGFSNVKPWYDSLALGDIGVLHNFNNLWGGASGRLAAQLAHEAFECWLYKGTIDPVTNTSYVTRAEKLARAITIWCTKALADNNNPLSFQNRDRIANLQMAMIYDFLYDQMTTAQRDTVRKALLAIAPTDISDLNLHNTPSYTATSNWATFGYEIMATLAVEDEIGYTPQHAFALQTYVRIVLNFLNYGMYEATGNMVECLGKNQLNAALMVALAKRGYSMLGHPSIRAFATKFWPAIIQPFGYSMVGSDLLGGTGLNSAAYGGWRDRIFDIIGLKWAYPRDNTIDFVWKNFVQRAHAGSSGSSHYYFYQDAFRTSLSQPTYWNHLYAPAFIT